jgi:hypothetical protein
MTNNQQTTTLLDLLQMSHSSRSISQQFNMYKYNELSDKLLPLMHDLSRQQKRIGLEALSDCCWTLNRQELSSYWCQQYQEPKLSFSWFSLLHFNIRHFYSNQADLIEMVNVYCPAIISLNELGTVVPESG